MKYWEQGNKEEAWKVPIRTRGSVPKEDRHSQKVIDSFILFQRGTELHMFPKRDKKAHLHRMSNDCWCDPVQGIAQGFWVHQFSSRAKAPVQAFPE